MSLASHWGYFVHVFDWQPLSTSPCSGSPTPPSTLGSVGLSPGVDTPGGHDVFILSPVYGHRYSHMKYKMCEKLFHLACRCNCIPLFILVLTHLERTIWIGVGLVCLAQILRGIMLNRKYWGVSTSPSWKRILGEILDCDAETGPQLTVRRCNWRLQICKDEWKFK